jgi:hypothetical protein
MSAPRIVPLQREDPAGLDKLLLALGKAAHDFVQAKAAQRGVKFDLWNGKDGLAKTLEALIKAHKIPNKRFAELVTPRSIAENTGVLKPKRRRR